MRILIAPDKFKGSLDAGAVAAALRDGFAAVFPDAEYDIAPIADGGEGTAGVFREALGGEWISADAVDALGRPIEAGYVWVADRKIALVEMSEASGLRRLKGHERDPLAATTLGTGQLMREALSRGAETLFVAIGGSATNDAGVGMAAALGWKFLDHTGAEADPRPSEFSKIRRVVPPAEPLSCRVVALSDVTNPLLGEHGATRIYGPQKGVTPDLYPALESALTHIADLCRDQLGSDARATPGAGAAGGLGFGLMTFCRAELQPGFDAVAGLLELDDRVRRSDLVLTGEGRLDAQTLHGKGPVQVARLARRHKKPVIAFAGSVEAEPPEFDACVPIVPGPISLEDSSQQAVAFLRRAAERTACLLNIPSL